MRDLIVDCQILQTPAFYRGMGKYTTKVLESLVAYNESEPRYGKIHMLFNKNLEDRSLIVKDIIKTNDIIWADIPVDISVSTKEKYEAATEEVTSIANKIGNEVDFLVMAPFFVGFPSVFPDTPTIRKFSIVYDFIPYKIWHLQRIFPDDLYSQHFELFIQADHLFTISHAVKDDLVNTFGIEEQKITSIDGGPFMNEENVKHSVDNLKLRKPYVLFPSAPIAHKNNDKAIKGFEEFNKGNDNKYTLYITSTFDEEAQLNLKSISSSIKFTGNISDEELIAAYKGADTVMFASLAEGLGMPVLESIICGVPVACSDIPVLTEIAEGGIYVFDPHDPSSIAITLDKAVKKDNWDSMLRVHKGIKKKYTWRRSAKLLLDRMNTCETRSGLVLKDCIKIKTKVPINTHSPIAQLVEEIYAPLRRLYKKVYIEADGAQEALRPSYTAYIYSAMDQVPKGAESCDLLNVSTSSKMFFFKDRGNIDITFLSGGSTSKEKINVCPITVDKALKVDGWKFSMNSQEILAWVKEAQS